MRRLLTVLVALAVAGCTSSHQPAPIECGAPPELPGGALIQRWDGSDDLAPWGRIWACEGCAMLEAEVLGRAGDLGCALGFDASWCLPNEDADGFHTCWWPPMLEDIRAVEQAESCAELAEVQAGLSCQLSPHARF